MYRYSNVRATNNLLLLLTDNCMQVTCASQRVELSKLTPTVPHAGQVSCASVVGLKYFIQVYCTITFPMFLHRKSVFERSGVGRPFSPAPRHGV